MTKTRTKQLRKLYSNKPTEDLMGALRYCAQKMDRISVAADHAEVIEAIIDERGDL
jgi:hypothetical protein